MKHLLIFLCCAMFIAQGSILHAGALKDEMKTIGENVGEDLKPLAQDVDYAGASVFRGIGAVAVAPLRFLQDVFDAISQGAAKEKLWDHTN
jgi:hypothetical protein